MDVLASLSETVAWCAARADAQHPGTSVRSAELMPPLFALPPERRLDQLLDSPAAASEAVRFITERRREALARAGLPAAPRGTLAGGRVFATDFNSDVCGVAAPRSRGFFDEFDVPGWDTWFAHEPTRTFGGTVYGWVPGALAALVERGISAIPVGSVWWVEESDVRRLLEWPPGS
jgi:hypothetical protein